LAGTFSFSNGGQGEDKGGDGGGGGGGGGGAIGGSGGYAGQDNAYGGGGGSGGGSKWNYNVATFQDQWENGSDGYINLKFTTQTIIPGITVTKTRKTTVSGTKTPTLTISTDSVGIQTVRCVISNPIAVNSSIRSDIVNFVAVSDAEQYNINVESVGNNSTATVSAINLANGDYTITTSSGDPNTGRYSEYYSIYSPDKDIDIEMDLYGSKGSDFGSYAGGEGGFSRVRFTLSKNTEYVIAGLTTTVNTPYIYRKGQLIACVGGGGNAGGSGRGGFGGGIGIAGQSGTGRGAGQGGIVVPSATLQVNGIFGSLTNLTPYSDDNKASNSFGGRVASCTKGVYWRNQGFTACQDIGTTQFRLGDGTLVSNTGSISRGFKAGYSIIETAGRALPGSTGANGGNGATGGNGSGEFGSGGGGGGSGYTDGSVTVVETQQGGSQYEKATVIIRSLAFSSFGLYTDSSGRILILSAATPGKNPTTLTRTTSKVLPNIDGCIDDTRWANFLNLARNENYRLTITTNSGTQQFRSITRATSSNLNKLLLSNRQGISRSLTDWKVFSSRSTEYILLAWDENSGFDGSGGDYSGILWDINNKEYGFYNQSSNPPFTNYARTSTCCWWILPPGVPDFP
jgi:hypothetical protein